MRMIFSNAKTHCRWHHLTLIYSGHDQWNGKARRHSNCLQLQQHNFSARRGVVITNFDCKLIKMLWSGTFFQKLKSPTYVGFHITIGLQQHEFQYTCTWTYIKFNWLKTSIFIVIEVPKTKTMGRDSSGGLLDLSQPQLTTRFHHLMGGVSNGNLTKWQSLASLASVSQMANGNGSADPDGGGGELDVYLASITLLMAVVGILGKNFICGLFEFWYKIFKKCTWMQLSECPRFRGLKKIFTYHIFSCESHTRLPPPQIVASLQIPPKQQNTFSEIQ